MIVTGLIEGGVFCQDMGDVVLTGVYAPVNINFQILDHQNNVLSTLSESYYPDNNNKVFISGLSELADTYLQGESLQTLFNPTSGFGAKGMFVTIHADLYQDEQLAGTFEQIFYQCNSRTKIFPSSYPYFLSRFRNRTIYPDQPVSFSFFMDRDTVLFCKAIYNDGGTVRETSTQVATASLPGYTAIMQYSLTEISSLLQVPADDIIEFQFQLCTLENETYTTIDVIKFVIDRNVTMERTMLLFKNTFGVPEIIALTGQNKRTSSLVGTYAWMQRKYRKVSTDLTELHTICSGWIDKNTLESIRDAIKSSEVFVIENSNLVEQVTITDIDLDYETPRTAPLAAYITYRVADRVQETFAREVYDSGDEEGIFDHTFDDSFE